MSRVRGADNSVFANVPHAEIPRSQFRRNCNYKTTFDVGFLVPVFCDEVLPGDTFNLKMTAFARMSTPIFPIMDNLYLDSFFFFVPNRLLWDDWEAFITTFGTAFIPPSIELVNSSWYGNNLYDYFGIPLPGATPLAVMSLAFRAYNFIWNEWFRDQNLQAKAVFNTASGFDAVSDFVLRKRGKRHDYFTSALPWPQKGVSTTIPLGGLAPLTIYPDNQFRVKAAVDLPGDPARNIVLGTTNNVFYTGGLPTPTSPGNFAKYEAGLAGVANLSGINTATINSLRNAFQIQKMKERDARGGSRYIETIYSHFGVTSPDARMQRPEYLGGGSTPVVISPIAQTAATETGTTPLGTLSALGYVHSKHGFVKSFTEHGYIIGLVSVRADMTYQQGLDYSWTRPVRELYYWPAFSHIGEQPILNLEIYAATNDAIRGDAFGYGERHGEYRFKNSLVTGKFRSGIPDPLDAWHLAYYFETPPILNAAFIQEDPPMDRVLAVDNQPHFLFDAYFDLKCARPIPMYSVPDSLGRF